MSEFKTETNNPDVINAAKQIGGQTFSAARTDDAASAIKEAYMNEPARFSALQVVDLAAEGAGVTEAYRNTVVYRVNDSCLRLAVFDEEYLWHYHPKSDELFIVVDGCLAIDLADGREFRLSPWQSVTIPAGVVHRTRAVGRTVNLCFEKLSAEAVFIEDVDNLHSDADEKL